MKVFTLISLAFLSSFLANCASTETKSILEERAGYGLNNPPPVDLNGKSGMKYVPTRVPERVVVAWLHAKELPSKDYFWGSWLSIVIAPEAWEMKKVEVPKNDKKEVKRTLNRSIDKTSKSKHP